MTWILLRLLRLSVIQSRHSSWWMVVTALLALPSVKASPESLYFIGNSFTWDSQPNNISTATTFPNELDPEIGWSIFSGKSLTFIVENPDEAVMEVALVAADYYPDPVYADHYEIDLLAQTWEAISIQPHTYGGGLFWNTEIAAANTIISKLRENADNQDTIVYIFGSWAFQEGPDKNSGRTYSQNWLSGYSQDQIDSGLLPNVRQAFRSIYWDAVKNQNPNVTVKWIPIGEVLYRIDQELQNGAIDGLSGSWDLFDQYGVHLHDTDEDGIAGRYISHITTLSTIWGSEPSTFQTKYDGVIDADFKSLVDQAVWSTILEFYPDIESCSLPEQFIQFPDIADASILEESTQLLATSSSNLPVSYERVSGPVSLVGNTVWHLSHGEVVIQATQAGNEEWGPASPVIQSFDIYSIADTWRLQYLGSYKNEGTAADLADPDLDSLPNLFEYFLGTSPTNSDKESVLQFTKTESGFEYRTVQSSNSVDGLSVFFESSQDLVNWNPLETERIQIVENAEGDLSYKIDANDLPVPYFVRLNISAL